MRIDRLQALSAHMTSKKRGLDRFYFGRVFAEQWRVPLGTSTSTCTTSGCMAGELPYAFPEYWIWPVDTSSREIIVPHLYAYGVPGLVPALKKFFELSQEQVNHIFFPEDQDTESYGGKDLNDRSSLQDVVGNLDIFINKARAGDFT